MGVGIGKYCFCFQVKKFNGAKLLEKVSFTKKRSSTKFLSRRFTKKKKDSQRIYHLCESFKIALRIFVLAFVNLCETNVNPISSTKIPLDHNPQNLLEWSAKAFYILYLFHVSTYSKPISKSLCLYRLNYLISKS
jgi:hypothetical protein